MLSRIALALCTLHATLLPGLEREEAAHLLRRTGFAPTEAELAPLLPMTREEAVDHLLAGIRSEPTQSPPAWATVDLGDFHRKTLGENDAWSKLPEMDRNKKYDERRKLWRDWGAELKAWWLAEMVATPSPLTERMIMIWHNHFTTELKVVENPVHIWEQHRLIRSKAGENFGRLAIAIPFDPAMFRYLDSNSNTKGRPNENFAREVMELYTVGEGNYTEDDIKEAARALSGYRMDAQSGRPVLDANLHDAGTKKVLGNKGYFDGEAILLTLMQKEEDVALQMARKMWREFIAPEPTEEKAVKEWDKQIWVIAKAFYTDKKMGHYFIVPLLRATLLHEAFWDPANRGTLVKSPFELLVGACRQLGVKPDYRKLVDWCAQLGQDPFDPPNVKGWSGHTSWVNSQSLMARIEILKELANLRSKDGWFASVIAKGEAGCGEAMPLLLAVPHPAPLPGKDATALILSSLYQLK